ncbi:transcriptional regulator [Pseudomonas prosekii]|uniref:Transcriptional regulator n=1 Tax=Pseudomonas prosekii TaxID=1148509 RepID=A0A3L8CEJ7_9PSED|nr:helix-turn-helix transcriptional regulator [Pseudomonas prosekii]RLU05916.1 transcriptional regulator [Pseudomonas prosekii]RLU06124.1 transcriptional regulator [Pseudomonas prosekii]
MEKTLATTQITQAMETAGLSQATLAERLGVSREAVSKWLKKDSFPKPDKLLRLATILGLSFSELVVKDDPNAPVVAFRKVKATKTTEAHYAHAQTMGKMLRHLVPYLPFDKLEMPPVLKSPVLEYGYLQEVAKKIRSEINLDEESKIDFEHLILHFKKLQAVIIPVLWGNKNRHENATHIFLPDSMTTWVYLNLDVNILDFKFWMAHELGHCLAPDIRGNEGEDFADAFAGALLFPHKLAKKAYEIISNLDTERAQISAINKIAYDYVISPYSVYCQINAYAEDTSQTPLDLVPLIHKASTNINRELPLASKVIFEENLEPDSLLYIERTKEIFKTSFFDILGDYLKDSGKGPGLVQTIMDVSALDARSIHSELL